MLERIKNAIWAFRQGPNLPLHQWEMMLNGDFAEQSSAGIRVNEAVGTRQATVYTCINVLSRDMSALPLKLYEKRPNGGRAEVTGHPLSEWLKNPNPVQTPLQWRQRGWYSVLATGNHYDQIIYNRDGTFATVPLDPARVSVSVDGRLRKTYEYTLENGTKRTLRSDQVFHNYGLSFDGFTGISPIRQCMETIGRAIAVEQYGAAYFQSPVPKVILSHPNDFKSATDREAFQTAWKEKFAGKKGIANVAVLPNGMEVAQIVKIPNNEAQFIETQKFSKEEIAQIYLVPMHRLQALDRATFSNIEHQALEYVQYSLLPWLTAKEQAIERQFLDPAERERYFVRHNVDALLRGDFKTRMEGYASGIQWVGLTPNERRALENLPAVEGGDDLLVPLNMVRLKDLEAEPAEDPADEPADEPDEPADEPDDDDERSLALNRSVGIPMASLRSAQGRRTIINRLTPRLRRVLEGEVRKDIKAIKANTDKLARDQRDLTQFWEWLTQYGEQRQGELAQSVGPVFSELGQQVSAQASAEIGVDHDEERAARYIRRVQQTFGAVWVEQLLADLRNTAQEAEAQNENAAEVVSQRLEQQQESKADKVARHEGNMLANGIARMVFVAAGFRLVWATFGENCPYCNDLAGKRVGGAEAFLGSGQFNPAGAESPLPIKTQVRQPPLHRGCVPGDSLVTSSSRIAAVSKRRFDGDLVIVRTAGNGKLVCTPNHPVLTKAGYVPASALYVGCDVIGDFGREWERFRVGDTENVPSRIEDVAESFRRTRKVLTMPMKVTAEDFHGDGISGDVGIVWADSELLGQVVDSAIPEHVGECEFCGGGGRQRLLAATGHPASLGKRVFSTASSGVSGGGLPLPFGGGHLGTPDFPGLAASSNLHSSFEQPSTNDLAANPKSASERVFRLTPSVAVDEIVGIDVVSFHGDVFNLQTDAGFYTAGGVVTHNCDCMVVPG